MKNKITIIGLGYEVLLTKSTALNVYPNVEHVLNLGELDKNILIRIFPNSTIRNLTNKPAFLELRAKTYERLLSDIMEIVENKSVCIPVLGDPYFLEGVSRYLISEYPDKITVIRGVSIIDEAIRLFPKTLSNGGLTIFDLSNGIENLHLSSQQNYLLVQYGRVGSKLNTLGYKPKKEWLRYLRSTLLKSLPPETKVSLIDLNLEDEFIDVELDKLDSTYEMLNQATSLFIHSSSDYETELVSELETLKRLHSPVEFAAHG